MFGVEEFHKRIERVTVCALGVRAAGAGGCDNVVCNIAEVEAGFSMPGARPGHELAQ